MGKIIFMKFRTKEEASKFVAHLILKKFGDMQCGQTMILGTATGQTPVLTYQEFINLVKNTNWWDDYGKDDIQFWQLDNYVSPGATEDNLPEYSYELELKNTIWRVPNGGTFIPREWETDLEEEAKRYAKLIEEREADYILQILGIGDEDGHIAFNMPGDSFDSETHVVQLNEETIRANANKFFGGDTDKVPKKAITMGIGEILESNGIILEAFGEKKADIIWKSFFTEPTTDIPATALQLFEGTLLVVLDEESARVITEKEGNIFTECCVNDEKAICKFCIENFCK